MRYVYHPGVTVNVVQETAPLVIDVTGQLLCVLDYLTKPPDEAAVLTSSDYILQRPPVSGPG